MVVGAIFQANLNADKIYIDMTYLPDPITHKFWLTIQNQSLSTLYFKIICNITNWSLDTPADGKLGSVAAGATKAFTPIITRSKPASETTDSGILTIEAYTDSNYTNKIGEDTLNVTVYIEDLESWTDVIKSDFDDGTEQGWTLAPDMSIANDESVEVGGYSVRANEFTGSVTKTFYVEKSIALPNRNKVRISFFLAFKARSGNYTVTELSLRYVSIKVDGVKVFDIPFIVFGGLNFPKNTTSYYGWVKMVGDLSAYKNQTKTVRIEWQECSTSTYGHATGWLDRIVIAGKD